MDGSMHAGLCEACAHQRVVRSGRGSAFSLCRRSADDPAWPRYPRLPVIECPGFELREGAGAAAGSRDEGPASPPAGR